MPMKFCLEKYVQATSSYGFPKDYGPSNHFILCVRHCSGNIPPFLVFVQQYRYFHIIFLGIEVILHLHASKGAH
jgi:hypothetical protein